MRRNTLALTAAILVVLAAAVLAANAIAATAGHYADKPTRTPVLNKVYIVADEKQAEQIVRMLSSSDRYREPFIISIDLRGVSMQTAINLIKAQAAKGVVAAVLTGDPETVNKVLHRVGFNIVAVPEEAVASDGTYIVRTNKIDTLALGVLYYNGEVKYYSSIIDLNGKLTNNIVDVYKAILEDLRNVGYTAVGSVEGLGWAAKTGKPIIDIATAQANFQYTKYPYGKLYIRDVVGDLSDSNPSYRWRYYQFRSQILPGVQAYGTEWRNSGILSEIDVDYYSSQGFLSDYDPTTTSGTSTVSVTLSVSISGDRDGITPGVGLSIGWSYSIPDVVVQDLSDFGQEKAKWIHHINPAALVGSSSYLAKPGAIFRFPEHGTYSWRAATLGRWAKQDCFLISCHWTHTNFYGLAYKWTVTS